MQKLTLKKFKIHLDIERLPTLTLYIAIGLASVCLLGAAWFTYRNFYVPYMSNTVPEDKLNQKQDKLNVKDFDDVRIKLEAKQKGAPGTTNLDPFQPSQP